MMQLVHVVSCTITYNTFENLVINRRTFLVICSFPYLGLESASVKLPQWVPEVCWLVVFI